MPTPLSLVLARHGHAEPGYDVPDGQRGLLGHGRRAVRAAAGTLLAHDRTVDQILTSPLVRAVQTAEILAGALGIDDAVRARTLIAEPPSIGALIELLAGTPADLPSLLVVGHQPTLGLMTAELIGRSRYPRAFAPATVVGLALDRVTKHATFSFAIEDDGTRWVAQLDAP